MEKQRWEESERRREEERRSKKRKSKNKEDAGARKGRKVAIHCVFRMIVAPDGRKVGSLKWQVRSHVVKWEMKSCTPLWHKAHSQVKICKTHRRRTTFGTCDVEKVHAVVARSTFGNQNVQNTSVFGSWCRKNARRFGAKHMSKSKFTKHTRFGTLLKVEMSKSARRYGAKNVSRSKW